MFVRIQDFQNAMVMEVVKRVEELHNVLVDLVILLVHSMIVNLQHVNCLGVQNMEHAEPILPPQCVNVKHIIMVLIVQLEHVQDFHWHVQGKENVKEMAHVHVLPNGRLLIVRCQCVHPPMESIAMIMDSAMTVNLHSFVLAFKDGKDLHVNPHPVQMIVRGMDIVIQHSLHQHVDAIPFMWVMIVIR